MALSVYGDAIVLDGVQIYRRRWMPFQPRNTVMSPCGHIHFAADSDLYSDDFSLEKDMGLQSLLIHELCHVWQAQQHGKLYLPVFRYPGMRYDYMVKPGKPFEKYNLEQQAEIAAHVFLGRRSYSTDGMPPLAMIEPILPFGKR